MNDKYDLNNTGAQVQEAITASLSTFPNQINALEINKVTKVSGKGLSENDYTNADKTKVSKMIISGDGSLFLSNDGTYKSASGVINYEETTNKPILNTDNDSSLEVANNEMIVGTISLHRISKTGSYSDLKNTPIIPTITLNKLNTTSANFYAPTEIGTQGQYLVVGNNNVPVWQNLPTIPTIKLNNVDTLSPKFYAPTTGGTNGYYLKSNGETVAPTWEVFPTIPTIKLNNADTLSPKFYAPITGGTNGYYLKSNGENNIPTWEIFPEIPNVGNLNTTSSSSISTSSRESFSQDINLHKISKTGSYNDLLNKPIISSVGSEEGPVILASLADGTYSISGSYKNNASSVDIIETTSPILVNKVGDNLTMISGAKTQVNYNTLNESIWTTKTSNLVQASSFDSIEIVTDFPTTMKQNVLYMRIEGV